MHRLVFTERAQADLLDAWLYIAEDNLAAADKVLDTLEQEAKRPTRKSTGAPGDGAAAAARAASSLIR